MGRFASTVEVYGHAREPYGSNFFATVAHVLKFSGEERLLDLGTGPGLLALGFAPFVGEVVGVDPEPAMIKAACEAANRSGVTLRLIEGRAENMPMEIGTFDVVTIGRALHWMDPVPTREVLDRIVAPSGRILLCRAASVTDGRNPWLDPYDSARRRCAETSGAERYCREPDAFFAGTAFRRARTITATMEQSIPIECLIDRVLSKSSSSRERLGDGVERMRTAMRGVLEPFARDGIISEMVEARAEVFEKD